MKKRILSFILACIILIANKFKVEADVYEFEFPKNFESDMNLDVVINSENIKSAVLEKYGIEEINSSNINNIFSLSLCNFNEEDLYELKKFKNLMYLSLRNGIISDSSFLKEINSLCSLTLFNCKLNDLKALKNTSISSIDIGMCCITNEVLEDFPESLINLRFYKEGALNNLNKLPKVCPNIVNLSLIYCSGVVNLEFIKELDYLKSLDAKEIIGCTESILCHINENDISTNLSKKDVEINEKLVNVVDSLVNNDMSDSEKVKVVCVYVKNNLKKVIYDNNSSLHKPLYTSVEKKKGTVEAFSYLTNVLLNLCNICSYEVYNNNHSWNLIEVNNKYYYIDMSENYGTFLIDLFNVGFYYMQDPMSNQFSKMDILTDLDFSDEEINNMLLYNENKTLLEKYLSNMVLNGAYLSLLSFILYKLNKKKIIKSVKKYLKIR